MIMKNSVPMATHSFKLKLKLIHLYSAYLDSKRLTIKNIYISMYIEYVYTHMYTY